MVLFCFGFKVNYANGFTCNGKIHVVSIYANGVVNINGEAQPDYTNICNLNEEREGVSTFMCALWVNTINSAREQNKNVIVYYQDTDVLTSCADLANGFTYGSAPAPVYIGY